MFNSLISLSFCLLNKEVVNEATDIGLSTVLLDSSLGITVCSRDFIMDVCMFSTASEIFSMTEFKGLTRVSLRQLVISLVSWFDI